MNTDNIYETRLPKSIAALTAENVRAEIARIVSLRTAIAGAVARHGSDFEAEIADDVTIADSAERDLMILVLKAAAFGHPNIRSLAFAVVENEI